MPLSSLRENAGSTERTDGLYPRFDSDVMAATITEVATPRWSEWERVTAPTLVLYAENGIFSEQQKKDFVARGGNATRIDLAGASQDAHLDAFNDWVAALTSFLKVHSGESQHDKRDTP